MLDFSVDIGGLDALGKNLDRTVENIDSASKRMEGVEPDSIGPEVLDEACSDFRSDWKEGLEKIREAIEKIKNSLDASKKCYAELDNAISQDLEKMASDVAALGNGKQNGENGGVGEKN